MHPLKVQESREIFLHNYRLNWIIKHSERISIRSLITDH